MTDWLQNSIGAEEAKNLRSLTTRWSVVGDMNLFVLRYHDAISSYLKEILGDANDAEEVTQRFLTKLLEKGLPNADPSRGRFRNYLIRSVKHAAFSYWREQKRDRRVLALEGFDPQSQRDDPDLKWHYHWKSCLVSRAMTAMEERERTIEGNLSATVLKMTEEFPAETSEQLAQRVTNQSGVGLSPAAFRQQLKRARHAFAVALLREVSETLADPAESTLIEELCLLGFDQWIDAPAVREATPNTRGSS